MFSNPAALVQRAIQRRLAAAFASDRLPGEQYTEPPGDPGLFGPESVTWRVYAHPSMLVGGISALMFQALHPLTIAGVAEHSDYRHDPFGRLSRTASFVTATTYGSTEVADSMISVVRSVHRHVKGIAPDGRAYSANDPHLLRWVHVTEVGSFLRAYRRYALPPLSAREQDRFFAEVAVVADKLGAADVPRSRSEVSAYMRSMRPELQAGAQAFEAMRFLRAPIGSDPLTQNAHRLLTEAATDLLPPWARGLYGLQRPPFLDAAATRPATAALLTALGATTGPSRLLADARARCEAPAAATGSFAHQPA
ncbi:MAG: oxygenase MpaB family protein [Acidimicrobiales bacterium]